MINIESFRQQLSIDDSQLSYIDIGQGPVVLIGHSFLMDAASCHPQIEALANRYRCIIPDLWGHGQSGSLPQHSNNLVDISKQMLELMDKLNIDEFSIFGQSIAGIWGTELAILAPKRITSLVLLNTFIGFEPEVTRDKYLSIFNDIKQTQGISSAQLSTLFPLYFGSHTLQHSPQLIEQFKQRLLNTPTARINDLIKLGRMLVGRRDTTEMAHLLTLPCLILSGTDNKIRSVLEGYLMQECIDGSEFSHIENGGHLAAIEQPERTNQLLTTFLKQHVVT